MNVIAFPSRSAITRRKRAPKTWKPSMVKYLPALYDGEEPDPTQLEMDLKVSHLAFPLKVCP